MFKSADELHDLHAGPFRVLLTGEWAEWRSNYIEQVRAVAAADESRWLERSFQELLWDNTSVSSVGPGQSVTVVDAYRDEQLARKLFEARNSLGGADPAQRGAALQRLYEDVLGAVHPRYTPRRPKARLVRLLAAMFPDDMTCLMDASRTFGVQRLVSAVRQPGDFVAQNPSIRQRLREIFGEPETTEAKVEQSMFSWFLWQEVLNRPDEGAVPIAITSREANAVPSFSLLPASAQRRSLASVSGNIDLLVAMLREAEQGISREDLVAVILSEATQLNASSAGNIISQAMGGLGLLRLEGNTYRPTERGLEMLTAEHPAHVLRGPLVGRVFGMGHLLLMVQRQPGELRPIDVSQRLKDLVPTWTSAQPGSYIYAWAKLTGLVQLDEGASGGRLRLTDDGEDYAAALPKNFEELWRIEPIEEDPSSNDDTLPQSDPPFVSPLNYGVPEIIAEGCFLDAGAIVAALDLLRRKKNLILQGPPGTGKTWLAKRLGFALMGARDMERLVAVQFQPSLSYEDFVRGWRPDGAGGLRLADGVFLESVAAARADPDRPYVLVIEEINRGNPAQVLGEMLTLIEDGKRHPDEALRLAYPRSLGERIYVPNNLYIIGTMNLADRSLALVDLALRRRFAFVSLTPLLNDAWRQWTLDRGCPSALVDGIAKGLATVNDAIAADRSLGPEYRVGHSFVTPLAAPGINAADWGSWYSEVVRTEIAPLLREYWYDRHEEAEAQIAKLHLGTMG
jgi:5-methylcytosine-specific restriction protein B